MRLPRSAGPAALAAGLMLAALSSPASSQGPRAMEARPERLARGLELHAFPSAPRAPFKLDESDEIAMLEAIRFALTEVGDGGSYVWYRDHGRLNGLVNPTSSFKDGQGRVCRHMVLMMSAGAQTGRIEGIACRDTTGRWLLEG